MALPELPVTEALPRLIEALSAGRDAVLVAPPGAGKTTLVPLALKDELWAAGGRIVVVEPRRLAARAAARRMAALLGEPVGATVGYAVRLDQASGPQTRVLVVTDGVFSRMALDDPELPGVAAVLFDEFHERSLDCDFGLALALDIKGALRPQLRLVAMSATLDALPVAGLMGGAPVIESRGRSFPVEIAYLPRKPGEPVEDAMASAIRRALADEEGSILAFLPGRAEIERTIDRLAGRLAGNVDLIALHGGLESADQDEAIRAPQPGRRKVVVSTSLAESSITIDGVRIVIDCGLARLPKFDPGTGLSRLETLRVSRASADQRAGRAGRTAPGIAWRLWHEGQNGAMPPTTRPEILEADLTGLVLDCAAFGVTDPRSLRFLDPPPSAALTEAGRQLRALGAIDQAGNLTATGAAMRRLPLPARLARMVVKAAERGEGGTAAEIAILVTERGLGGASVDLERRLAAFRADRGVRARQAAALAGRIALAAGDAGRCADAETGRLLADAFGDRVAEARGRPGEFRLASGTGARMDETDPLALSPYLVVADLQGRAAGARITAAAAISREAIERALSDRIETDVTTTFDPASASLRRRGRRRLGVLVLGEAMLPPPSGAEADRALIGAVREHGLAILPWNDAATSLRARLAWLRRAFGAPWPEMDDDALAGRLEEWLLPFLSGEPKLSSLSGAALDQALRSLVTRDLEREIDRLAPPRFTAPTGSRFAIRYDGETPVLSIRVQELYGLDTHPAIAGGRVPLLIELLSPAGRPIQTTRDLPGFWRGSWQEVRREMRGRYPKHDWPERPEIAAPTTRARPRRV
jgi:ATP-dependent helicase HrpB